jgi:hypothetical protein
MRSLLPDVIKIPVPCPHCGKEGLETVGWLVRHDVTPCGNCRVPINLRTAEWRAYLDPFAEFLDQIGSVYNNVS